jgi:hypothetical protein
MRHIKIISCWLFFLPWVILPDAIASTLRVISVQVSPSEIEFTCERSSSIVDVQTRESIARRYGLVGKVNEITQMISAMRSVGYRVDGADGQERLQINVPYRGFFQKTMKFNARATLTEAHLFGRYAGPGRGRAIVDNRVKQYLTDANRAQVEKNYEGWANQFDTELDAVRGSMNDHLLVFFDAERPDLSHAMHGVIHKVAPINVCKKHYKVAVQIRWERSVALELGR